MPLDIRTILIIKWGALGDIVASTPAIRAVRESFPRAHIVLLSNALMKQIVPAGTLADEVIVYDEGHGLSWFTEHLRIIHSLRKKKFDIVFNLRWTSDRSALLSYFSGARKRIGSGPRQMMFLYTGKISPPPGFHHEIERNLDIVTGGGATASSRRPYVCSTPDDVRFADTFFQEHGLERNHTIAIHPGASKPVRAWLPDRFAEIARACVAHFGCRVLLTWGPGEEELVTSIASMGGDGVSAGPRTGTIGRLASIIEHCGLFVSNCTGPMNVAMATSTPIIALLAATNPIDWAPNRPDDRYIKSPLDLPSYSDDEEHEAVKAIQTEAVWSLLSERWTELHHG